MPTSTIWVKHPKTGQEINVAPLLLALDQFDAPLNAPLCEGARDAIRQVIRVINLSEHNPVLTPGKLIDVYYDLHRLEDVFTAMSAGQVA